jgi:hypothetical protein
VNVHIEVLQRRVDVPQLLLKDGWTLDDSNDVYTACHPDISSESAARNRLYHLGLLTSPAVRIRFHK